MGGACVLPPYPLFTQVQAAPASQPILYNEDLISNLTYAHSSTLWHGHKGALEVRAGLIDTYMDIYNSPKIPEHQSYTIGRLL